MLPKNDKSFCQFKIVSYHRINKNIYYSRINNNKNLPKQGDLKSTMWIIFRKWFSFWLFIYFSQTVTSTNVSIQHYLSLLSTEGLFFKTKGGFFLLLLTSFIFYIFVIMLQLLTKNITLNKKTDILQTLQWVMEGNVLLYAINLHKSMV